MHEAFKMAGYHDTVRGGSRDPLRIGANIFISFIGAGILGLPHAFKKAGLLEGILVLSFVAYFAYRAMLLLIHCKYQVVDVVYDLGGLNQEFKSQDGDHQGKGCDRSGPYKQLSGCVAGGEVTYSDIGYAAFGTSGRSILDISLLTSQIGFCCGYLIFISENLSSVYPNVEKSSWLLLLLPALFFLTLVKELSRFAVLSLVAQGSNLLAFLVVYWFDFQHLHLAQVHPQNFSVEGLPYFFSVAIYCFEGAGMIISLEESVAPEARHKFNHYFKSTLVVITLLYVTFGAAGYLSYGPNTQDIITLNLPQSQGINFALIVKSCLCFSLFFTYPVMLFPVFSILESKLPPFQFRCLGMRAGVVILTGLIVISVPNFGELMALVGATCCNLLAFVMPALCHIAIFRQNLSMTEKALDIFLFILGLAAMLVGTLDFFSK